MSRRVRMAVYFSAALIFWAGGSALHAGWQVDVESGVVLSGYNDVRIPGDTGTTISLSQELETEPKVFFRGRVSYTFGRRHTLSALVAPLTLNASGSVDRDVSFQNVVFPANTPLDAVYRFDSYRLTYRYDVVLREKVRFGFGLTGKIRDASVSLASASESAEKTNTGFVPLINFRAYWVPFARFGFLLEGDALAAPQGRAEDILLALTCVPVPELTLKAGYRLLEGGADNEEVYSFALLNYVVIGAILSF